MDKAMAYIDKLAAKLGVAAEHVYGVLVKQAVVGGGTFNAYDDSRHNCSGISNEITREEES